ncbi:hypothetical protein [Haloferax volcanii]
MQEGDTVERRNSEGEFVVWTVINVEETDDGTTITYSTGGGD